MATALTPADFVQVVRDNQDYISKLQISERMGNLDDDFGWFRVVQQYQELAGAEQPDNISLMEFDDHNDRVRLAYGIGVNK